VLCGVYIQRTISCATGRLTVSLNFRRRRKKQFHLTSLHENDGYFKNYEDTSLVDYHSDMQWASSNANRQTRWR